MHRIARNFVWILTFLISAVGVWIYWRTLDADQSVSVLEWMSLPFFALLFVWIAFSFSLATCGFLSCLGKIFRAGNLSDSTSRTAVDSSGVSPKAATQAADSQVDRTAILMPVYNESPSSVYAAVLAMVDSLEALERQDGFDFYILSDTTRFRLWLQEETVWREAVRMINQKHPNARCRLFYRHRSKNIARKSGNIAEFCRKWGDHYEHMIVLDADSLIEGSTIIGMVDKVRANPKIGILQIPPVPIGRTSLFARVQQFSAEVYGPIFATGFSEWAGVDGNYFGHNAIIRVDAFKQNCNLPILPGKAPLGGEILSHDFVEAALMLRAGYQVIVDSEMGGSFEECPTTITDFAQRDQRWCQGNLQHSRLVISEGFKPLSRVHFLTGLMSYCAAPIWIIFMLIAIAAMIFNTHSGSRGNIEEIAGMPAALGLFLGVMMMLFAPKFYALFINFAGDSSQGHQPSGLRLAVSVGVEMVLSVLLAPMMAIMHSWFVITTLAGRTVQWKAQERGEHDVRWAAAFADFWWLTLIGLLATAVISWWAPVLLPWFSPLLIGLLLSIPLAVIMGSAKVGECLMRRGILSTANEISPPLLAVARDRAASVLEHRWKNRCESGNDSEFSGEIQTMGDRLFMNLLFDNELIEQHISILDRTGVEGSVTDETRQAIEKAISDASVSCLTDADRFAILCDPEALRTLAEELRCGRDQ